MGNAENRSTPPDQETLIRLTLFGGLSVSHPDGSHFDLPTQQSPALLAYLALNRQRPQSRDAIIALFWPDSEPEKGRQNLRRCLHYLRDRLEKPPYSAGSVLQTTRNSVHLNPKSVWTDVVEFEETLDAAIRSEDAARRIELRRHAAELYRGELLPGFYQDGFVLERHRLAQQHFDALMSLISDLEAEGGATAALSYAYRAAQLDPLSERAHCAVMRLHAALGQGAAARRQYSEFEARLRAECGMVPSAETVALASRLRDQGNREAPTRSAGNGSGSRAATCQGSGQSADPVMDESAPAVSTSQDSETPVGCVAAEAQSEPEEFAAFSGMPAPAPTPRSRMAAVACTVAAALFVLLCLFLRQSRSNERQVAERSGSPVALPQPVARSNGHEHPARSVARTPEGSRVRRRPTNRRGLAVAPAIPPLNRRDAVEAAKAPVAVRDGRQTTDWPDPVQADAPRDPVAHIAATIEGGARPSQDSPARRAPDAANERLWAVDYVPQAGVRTIKADVDWLTLKYSPAGKLIWQRRYDGPGHDLDRARSMAVDGDGNVYVTGESDGGKGHGADHLSGLDIATIKYGPDGKPSATWPDVGFGIGVRRYAGPADGRDSGKKITLDSAGNVYVFGQSWGGDPKEGGSGNELILIQYDPTGNERWNRRYPVGNPDPDAAVDMAVDDAGRAFVVGRASPSDAPCTLVALCFDPDGNRKWEHRYAGQARLGASPSRVLLSPNSDVYVVGSEALKSTPGGDPEAAYLVTKYLRDGSLGWIHTYPWRGYRSVQTPFDAALDGDGNLYVTGDINGGHDAAICGTLKFASDGAVVWADTKRTAGHRGHYGRAVAINSLGDVVVAGWATFLNPIRPTCDIYEFAAYEYAPANATVRRLLRYAGSNGTYGASLLAIDFHDNVIVCGQAGFGQTPRIAVVKYCP
jgi:DNA-binding SARP family transcriptional activator